MNRLLTPRRQAGSSGVGRRAHLVRILDKGRLEPNSDTAPSVFSVTRSPKLSSGNFFLQVLSQHQSDVRNDAQIGR